MAGSEFFILESCKNPGQRIIAQFNGGKFGEVAQNEKQLGDMVALESNIGFEDAPKKGIEPITIFVYYSSNDAIVGCFTLVEQTKTEGYDYYISPMPGERFKNCGDCQYQLGVDAISNQDSKKRAEESKNILINIINNR